MALEIDTYAPGGKHKSRIKPTPPNHESRGAKEKKKKQLRKKHVTNKNESSNDADAFAAGNSAVRP